MRELLPGLPAATKIGIGSSDDKLKETQSHDQDEEWRLYLNMEDEAFGRLEDTGMTWPR